MDADVELAGVVGDDDHALEEPVCPDRSPQRPFGGDGHRIRGRFHAGNAQVIQVGVPSRRVGELPLGMAFQLADDDDAGQVPPVHVGKCLVAQHMARSSDRKLARLLDQGVAKKVKRSLPIWVQMPFLPLCWAPVSSAELKPPCESTEDLMTGSSLRTRKKTMRSGAMHSSPLPPFARDFRQINVARGGNEDAQGTADRAGDATDDRLIGLRQREPVSSARAGP